MFVIWSDSVWDSKWCACWIKRMTIWTNKQEKGGRGLHTPPPPNTHTPNTHTYSTLPPPTHPPTNWPITIANMQPVTVRRLERERERPEREKRKYWWRDNNCRTKVIRFHVDLKAFFYFIVVLICRATARRFFLFHGSMLHQLYFFHHSQNALSNFRQV